RTRGNDGPGPLAPPLPAATTVLSAQAWRQGIRFPPRIAPGWGDSLNRRSSPMSVLAAPTPTALSVHVLQVRFLSILPRIELHGRISFRYLRCPALRADAVAEVVALAWKWHLGLAERGKDATQFPSALATFAARAVKAGRRVCGRERARDVLSPSAHRKQQIIVERLPDFSTLGGNPLEESLVWTTRRRRRPNRPPSA